MNRFTVQDRERQSDYRGERESEDRQRNICIKKQSLNIFVLAKIKENRVYKEYTVYCIIIHII